MTLHYEVIHHYGEYFGTCFTSSAFIEIIQFFKREQNIIQNQLNIFEVGIH